MPSLLDRITGAVVGLAVGDALGYPHEFRTVAQVRREIGPQGITDFLALKDPRFTRPFIAGRDHAPGTFTDDTQMSLCLAEALIAHGAGDAGCARERSELAQSPVLTDDALCADAARRFVDWYFSDDNDRSPGASTGTACERLKEGVSWREAGVPHSKGAGANMRVVPVGLFYDDLDDVDRVARLQAGITHGHAAAAAASAATAIATALFLRGASVGAVVEEVRARCCGVDAAFDRLWLRFADAKAREPAEVLRDVDAGPVALGEAWVAEEAFFSALYCVARAPDSYERAVLLAVNTDGDSDTIATLVGGFMGARLGLEAIPARWRDGVEASAALHDVGARLSAARRARLGGVSGG